MSTITAADARRTAKRLLLEAVHPRTLKLLLYSALSLPLGFTLAFVIGLLFALTVAASAFVVGIPLLAAVVMLGRSQGGIHRTLARWLLDVDVPPPPPLRTRSGTFGWLVSGLADATGWRGLAYLVVKLPVALAGFLAGLFLYGIGGLFASYPFWGWAIDNTQVDSHGKEHDSVVSFGDTYVEAWYWVLLMAVAGFLMLVAAPWILRGIAWVDAWLMKVLLGPSKTAERVQELEETRAIAVDDSAARLRRIERDLHDGAQARIVALAMHLSQAQERLDPDDDSVPVDLDKARKHVDTALGNARLAISELRDLARGIHPPALDNGLDDALATLAAGNPVPVDLNVDLRERPPAAIETITYFCVAELLANATRHAQASAIHIEVRLRGDTLVAWVGDDGVGGAAPHNGSGLTGLAERVRTVDGTLTVDSPRGGPTQVTLELPVRS
ncbi:sensor histidine kinase [Yinghuangia seranimata]|uniref:sensor histidine kinase n=1 Tax=Yinghuangia seranimata TaxID=408067 RepID=UPI00248BE228|nr:sensor histidine kinase [Yinghuangia seranimata]MDI2124845.1 sensor domain-containing protein [Yinghuangia seranimata]